MLRALSGGDVATYAAAGSATSSKPTTSFGQGLFEAFISSDTTAVQAEFDRFMRTRILGAR
jgi:hypothetical protein